MSLGSSHLKLFWLPCHHDDIIGIQDTMDEEAAERETRCSSL
jgi:hypothetical protein